MKIADDSGHEVPWGGKSNGDLLVKGPRVIQQYYRGTSEEALQNEWFPTGHGATIDGDGYMTITDRRKDVIKSGRMD
jgi:fatty-acyl-CoA synthase